MGWTRSNTILLQRNLSKHNQFRSMWSKNSTHGSNTVKQTLLQSNCSKNCTIVLNTVKPIFAKVESVEIYSVWVESTEREHAWDEHSQTHFWINQNGRNKTSSGRVGQHIARMSRTRSNKFLISRIGRNISISGWVGRNIARLGQTQSKFFLLQSSLS